MITLIKLATNDQTIVARITKRILLGESLEQIWLDHLTSKNYLRVLLEKFHVDPNTQDKYGETALYYTNDLELAKLLLEHGVNPNIKNKYGETSLIWACRNGYTDIVKCLLEHGADPNIKNQYGRQALSFAWLQEIRDLLIQHGAK